MDLWNMALDALPDKKLVASTDQKLAYANVLAILAVGQQLSRINEGESKFAESVVNLARRVDPPTA